MKLTLQQTIKTSLHGMVSIKVNGNDVKLSEVRNFIIFNEEIPEELLADLAFQTFPELLSITFNDHETYNTIYTRDE